MHHRLRRRFAGSCARAAMLATALAGVPVFAADETVEPAVVAGGGTTTAAGGGYTLDGTIAQPIAGASAGGGYTLDAGFWQPIASAQTSGPIFSDSFED